MSPPPAPPTPPTRASWRGELVLDLVNISVAAYNVAARRQDEVHFHQLHAACHSRVRHEKVCPVHGALEPDEIVLGYEFAPDRFVEVGGQELSRLRSHQQQRLTLHRFVAPGQIDPLHYDGRAYYLIPEDRDAAEPFAILLAAIRNRGVCGIGEIVLSAREQWVVVRPWQNLLVVQMLRAATHVRGPEGFGDELIGVTPAAADVVVAEDLIAALTDETFDIRAYEDVSQRKLRSLIDAKLAGQEIVASPLAEVQPQVINMGDALRRSVDRARLSRGRVAVPPRRSVP